MRIHQATNSTCKFPHLRPLKQSVRRFKSRQLILSFSHRGILKFDITPGSADQTEPPDCLQDQQQNDSHVGDKDDVVIDGIETYVFNGGKTLVVEYDGSLWGNATPDLVVIVIGKTSFKEIVAPYKWIVIKCSMQGDSYSSVGLSSVEIGLPNSLTCLQRGNGVCFWKQPSNIAVLDKTTLPATTRVSWPVRNPAFVDAQQGLASVTDQHYIDPELFPIRLIDIQATLSSHGGICFYKPTNWSFHTISHTWSQGVRSFSIAVGKLVSGANELYNSVFRDANFLDDNSIFFDDPKICEEARECYIHLIAFFRLLQEEGVKAVWFDALCINQLESVEKEREIARMGDYYEQSSGCYVLSHGVGMGYTLWALNGDEVEIPPPAGQCTLNDHISGFKEFRPALPRWFYRVWTLQEFVLPQKLTFIVGGLSKLTIGRVNVFIRQAGCGSTGLCMCTLPYRVPQFRYWDRGGNLRKAVEEEEIHGSECVHLCERCGHVPFIRKSHEGGVYFVDREAYCFLCQVDLGPSKHWIPHSMEMHPEFMLWNLTAIALVRHGQGFMMHANSLSMLQKRECSVEEDRVLGMLGLLKNVSLGKFQVRTGQSLRFQLWQLHKIIGVRAFLKLWMMDVAGSPEMDMSWVPSCFLNEKWLPEVSSFNFSVKGDLNMRILDSAFMPKMFEEGPMLVVASTLSGVLTPSGQIRPCQRLNPQCHRFYMVDDEELSKVENPFGESEGYLDGVPFNGTLICPECIFHNQSCEHWIRHCQLLLEVSQDQTLRFSLAAHEGGCIYRSSVRIRNDTGAPQPEIDFRMVLAGVNSVSALKPFSVRLVKLLTTSENVFGLVCITRLQNDGGREVYHKIGTFTCPIQLDPFPMSNRSYYIGGFGRDISKYVC